MTAQILLDGAQEILGMETVRKVVERLSLLENQPRQNPFTGDLERDLSIAKTGPFLRELKVMYGERGGDGLAVRIGRAAFRSVLKHLGEQAGFRATEFRLLPASRRLENGLRILARMVGEECGGKVAVSDEGAYWLWRIDRSRSNGGTLLGSVRLPGDNPCYLIAGLLQEFTTWAGGGRFYPVVETECLASGSPACLYRIEKRPID